MKTVKMSADEKKWRADSDLETLIQAEKIKKDPARLKAAMAARKEKESDLMSIKEVA